MKPMLVVKRKTSAQAKKYSIHRAAIIKWLLLTLEIGVISVVYLMKQKNVRYLSKTTI
jgi:hypothetical protein